MMCQRQPGAIPSQPEPNPRETVNAITFKSGKSYDDPTMPRLVADDVVTENHQTPI